jgi:hypothetical protein
MKVIVDTSQTQEGDLRILNLLLTSIENCKLVLCAPHKIDLKAWKAYTQMKPMASYEISFSDKVRFQQIKGEDKESILVLTKDVDWGLEMRLLGYNVLLF